MSTNKYTNNCKVFGLLGFFNRTQIDRKKPGDKTKDQHKKSHLFLIKYLKSLVAALCRQESLVKTKPPILWEVLNKEDQINLEMPEVMFPSEDILFNTV